MVSVTDIVICGLYAGVPFYAARLVLANHCKRALCWSIFDDCKDESHSLVVTVQWGATKEYGGAEQEHCFVAGPTIDKAHLHGLSKTCFET